MDFVKQWSGTMLTYGIITDGQNMYRLNQMVKSITAHCPEGEILIVGLDKSHSYRNIRCLPAYSRSSPFHITRLKNVITQEAKFDSIVYTHDYVEFCSGWAEGYLTFCKECEWDIAMNILLTQDGKRFRDWCVWSDKRYGGKWVQYEPWCPPEGVLYDGKPCLVPYHFHHTDRMYISGTYWLAKKHVMLAEPLNEKLYWGQAEDVEWSLRVRNKYRYKMNTYSTCKLLKEKDVILPYVDLQNES